ncbi:MAG: LarC family nickel insertion protein [Desulfobacterales bacterium]|nr:LarC family nickel insertion protein [Desulfobacterales bacterium]
MIGYLDLPSGISGDMWLGCLLDCGWPVERLRSVISRLGLPAHEWSVDVRPVKRGVLRASLAGVRVAEGPRQEGAKRSRSRHHDHGCCDHCSHLAVHRNLQDVQKIIDDAHLPEPVKRQSVAVFERLAHAEAKVHGCAVEYVHFHEVGALDAIVDIVGTVAGIHELGIDSLFASAVPLGEGWTDTDHGSIPLPAPATLEMLAVAGAPTRRAPGEGELVTPTGAALLCEMAAFGQPDMRIEKIGVGAGRMELDWPNVARLWIGVEGTATKTAGLCLSEGSGPAMRQ